VEKHVFGTIYVDKTDKPETFYVIHPYGQSLLFGKIDNDVFNLKLLNYMLNKSRLRDKNEWLQAYPDTWNKKLSELLGDKLFKPGENSRNVKADTIEINTRVNFKFNAGKYLAFKKNNLNGSYTIIRTDKDMFENIQGKVVPKYFWKDAVHFYSSGAGFTLIYNNESASTAFSSFVHDDQLEIGIETAKNHQGKGLAAHSCSALIDYCIKNNYKPVWSCSLENTGSYMLAQKLGFEPTAMIPYYRLNI
jgi:hypothetical protein